MPGFTVLVRDSLNLLGADIKAQLQVAATYVGELVTRYIDFQGTLDIEVDIQPHSALTFSDADGLLPALGQISWNGTAWVNDTLSEAITGIDRDPNRADAGATLYLAKDGTIRNYGIPVWFDPAPAFDTRPDIPAGTFDIIGVLTHEVFHTLGLYGATLQWQDLLQQTGSQWYFTGANTRNLYGGALPLAPAYSDGSPPDHYGNLVLAENRVPQGLMFQYGNYELNRLDIGRIDLAILQDLGVVIKTSAGLPLFELLDYAPDLNGSAEDDVLYANYQNNVLTGNAGNDRFYPGTGVDVIEGGAGQDTVIIEAAASNYRLSWKNGTWTAASVALNDSNTLSTVETLEFADRRIDISSSAHASYEDLPDGLWHFFIVAFNGAPGVTYMNQLANAWHNGTSLADIVSIFTGKSQFTDLYPVTLSHDAFASRLVNTVVGTSASTAAITRAQTDIVSALDAGQSVGEVIFTIFGNLAAVPSSHPLFGDTALQFARQIELAQVYTDIMDQSTTDPDTLRSVLAGATPDPEPGSEQALIELIGLGLLGNTDSAGLEA